MIEKFFKKIIQVTINQIYPLDMISENICKVRKEIKDFFNELENFQKMMKNFGQIIQSEYDKNNFIIYDEIMEIVNFYFFKFIL